MKKTLLILTTLIIAACGTTSGIQQQSNEPVALDFSKYDTVYVSDFGDSTKKGNMPEFAGVNFADRIVAAVRSKGVFKTVTKKPEEMTQNTLKVGGDITRYAEGNTALKFLVGFGAGSTYFDSVVLLTDQNDSKLGEIKVDKNSWALGGAIAAGQTVDQFMSEAAQKIATEIANAKLGIKTVDEEEIVTGISQFE